MKAEKFELRYCIEHEKVVPVWASADAVSHTGPNAGEFFGYAEFFERAYDCYGPFTFSAPPELGENWELSLDAPSSDELAEMDATAVELLTEFELV